MLQQVANWRSQPARSQPPEELTQDLLAILTVFSARANGLADTGRKSKIRIYPTGIQKPKLKLWFGRPVTYNRTIELLTADGAPRASWLGVKKDILSSLPDWTARSDEVKSNAVRRPAWRSARQEIEPSCLTKSGIRKEQTYARARFRSRKNPSQTIIHASALSHRGVYHTLLGMKKREPIPHAHGDAKLTLRHHQYHLSVPFKRMGPHLGESNLQPKAPDQVKVVALDPGVRNFIAWFSEDGCGKPRWEKPISDESRGCASTRTTCCPVLRRRRHGATAQGRRKNDRQDQT